MAISDRDDLEGMFGVDNIAQWADLDNNQNAANILTRITAAVDYAEAEVYDRLRGGPQSARNLMDVF